MKTRDDASMLGQPDQPRAAALKRRIWGRGAGGTFRLFLTLMASAAVLSGCAFSLTDGILTKSQVEERTPMRQVPVTHAWVSAPEVQVVLQRDLGFGSEQRISLRNRTLVPEDNLIVLRTRSGMSGSGRLRFEEFMRRVGEPPYPFADVSSGELIGGSDELGNYLWTEKQLGVGTVCVFGVRRVDNGMRQIPGGGGAMDIMLRNCVIGTAEEALRPLLAASVGSPLIARAGTDQSRLISPLAGPTLP